MKYLLILLLSLNFNICDEYEATVLSVYDGDTITCDIDLGFNIHLTEKIRLYGIDAPEVRGSEKIEGYKSRDALRDLILGEEVSLINYGRGKYGRVIADVVFQDTIIISSWMVREGYAIHKDY